MNYRVAYDRLLDRLLHDLSEVETGEAARDFSARAAEQLRKEAATVPEFYVGEFLKMFGTAALSQVKADATECAQAAIDAKREAQRGKVVLQARLDAATAAGDREAEHAVWREREELQAASQGKIDTATTRIDLVAFRMTAVTYLASAFGIGDR